MGDLAIDTTVHAAGDGRFTCDLNPDWEIWGPNGGYLASVALRAAGAASERTRPASISAHFVGSGQSGTVDVITRIVRSTRVATSVSVRIEHDGRPWLEALVWGVDDDLPGIDHQHERPDVNTDPESLPNFQELMSNKQESPHAFWANLDQRPLTWVDDWENREPSAPHVWSWNRFVPTATFDDAWVDACRSLILLDVDAWLAATRPHVGELDVFAPTIDVTARFVANTSTEPWLLSEARSPVASGGLVNGTGQIWTRDLRLVATGGSTLLCRPAARRPDR